MNFILDISNDMDTINLNYAALGALRPDQTLFYARLANRMKALGQLFFQTVRNIGEVSCYDFDVIVI